ncbi:MAG: hypothetical protein L0Y58_01150 [Verrucomicrobia subdivision 3 bacterium]|nr:hypothetical protein [Limisphaerales bacterium]
MTPEKVILVYNADDGLFNALSDWAHKLFSPATHQCHLCRYTIGLSGMRFPWKEFLESLGCPLLFFHRPDFRELYPNLNVRFPVILVEVGGEPTVLLSASEIAKSGSLDGLIEATRDRFTYLTSQQQFHELNGILTAGTRAGAHEEDGHEL